MASREYHIVTMGKVASRSFAYSLHEAGFQRRHYHSLERYRALTQSDDEIVVITGIRDLVARNMSYFFQTCTDDLVNDLGEYGYVGPPGDILAMEVDDVIDAFFAQDWHFSPLLWWRSFWRLTDARIARADVVDGFASLSRGPRTVLAYRMEDLAGPNRLSAVLPIASLSHMNDAADRWYADLYKAFKARIAFPRFYLDRLLNAPVMREMYADEERERFMGRYQSTPDWL